MKKRTVTFKVTVSIVFGLLGFAINFLSIDFPFPPYTATILIGLLFPMLITLAWGWKYGLLSALIGGCQSMWWLWGPSNGYATFLVVPPFTLWIVWHGLIANAWRRRKDRKWWLSPYAVEIPFRILSTINLFTLARLAIRFNPPPWSWASNASSTISFQFSSFVVVKQAVVGCVILLLADVILSFRWAKRFFGLEEDRNQKNTNRIIGIALLLGFLFWIIDSVVSSSVFHPENSFLDALALNVSPFSLYVRTFFLLACLMGGLLASRLLRKQYASDAALQTSEETYRLLANNAIDVIWQTDLKLVFTYVSPSVEDVTGYTVEEWVGTRLSQYSSREEFFNMARQALSAIKHYKEVEHVTFRAVMLRKDGTEIPVEITGKLLLNRNGLPIGLQGTTRDITKRVQAEKSLQEAHNIISQSPTVAFLWKNEEGYPVEYVSDNVEDLYGYTVKEFSSGEVVSAKLIHPDDLKRVTGAVTAHSKDKESKTFSHVPYRIVTKSGVTKWVDDRTSIRRDSQGQITHYQAIISDITDRKQAEEALRNSNENFQQVVTNITTVIWKAKIADDGTFNNTYISPAADALLALPVGTLQDAWGKYFSYIKPEYLEQVSKAFREAIEAPGKLIDCEYEVVKDNGETVWFYSKGRCFERNGELHVFGSTADITDRKQAEERVAHLNLVLRAVRNVNQLITKEKDRDKLLKGSCDNLVETRSYFNAWITLLDEYRNLVAYAESGLGEEFLPMIDRLKRGQLTSCVQKALKQSEPVVTKDPFSTCTDCSLSNNYAGRSAATVRLEYGGKVYGLLTVSAPLKTVIDVEELHLFHEVAADIAFGLYDIELEENSKRAEEKLRKRTEEMELLYKAGQQLSQTLNLATIYRTLYDLVSGIMDCDSLVVSSFDSSDGLIRCVFNILDGKQLDASVLPAITLNPEGKGTQSIAIHTGEALLINDYQARVKTSDKSYYMDEKGVVLGHDEVPEDADVTRSALIIPMKHEGQVVGVVQVMSYKLNAYTEDKLRILQSLVVQIAVASNNARLYQQAQNQIIQRKQTELNLLEERNKAQKYLDIAGVILIALDVEGIVTLINRKGCEILGYKEEEIVGKNWFDNFIPADLRENLIPFSKEVLTGNMEAASYHENCILTKSGEERMIAWHNTVLTDADGQIVGHLSSGEDITERKRVEKEKHAMDAQLRQSQKLESIGTLASGVAHEINNPLMGMINYADLIGEKVEDDTAKKYSRIIMKEGHRIADIVRNLLSFSRQDKETHSPAGIKDIVNRSLSLVGSVMRKDQITIEVDIPEDLPQVRCRNQQIQQVIINLLTNAKDALNERYSEYDENKLIRITARPFEKDRVDWIRITVEDHGVGMTNDVVQRIFDPFYTTKRDDKGTGLGLSVSYGIVKEHHGELTVESELGKYTRFHMDLLVNNGWSLE